MPTKLAILSTITFYHSLFQSFIRLCRSSVPCVSEKYSFVLIRNFPRELHLECSSSMSSVIISMFYPRKSGEYSCIKLLHMPYSIPDKLLFIIFVYGRKLLWQQNRQPWPMQRAADCYNQSNPWILNDFMGSID